MVKPRPPVDAMQAYSAPLEGRRGLLRLDFNENTVGPSPKVVEAIRSIPPEHYAIYPEYAELEARYGERMGLTAEHVGLFNGVDAAIHAVFQAFGNAGDIFLTTTPTFGYYAPCAQQQGMVIQAIPYQLPHFAYPEQAIAAALTAQAADSDDLQPQQSHGHPPGSGADRYAGCRCTTHPGGCG